MLRVSGSRCCSKANAIATKGGWRREQLKLHAQRREAGGPREGIYNEAALVPLAENTFSFTSPGNLANFAKFLVPVQRQALTRIFFRVNVGLYRNRVDRCFRPCEMPFIIQLTSLQKLAIHINLTREQEVDEVLWIVYNILLAFERRGLSEAKLFYTHFGRATLVEADNEHKRNWGVVDIVEEALLVPWKGRPCDLEELAAKRPLEQASSDEEP